MDPFQVPSSLTTDQKIEAVNSLVRSLAQDDLEAAEISHRVCVINQLIARDLREYGAWRCEFDIETARISESELGYLRFRLDSGSGRCTSHAISENPGLYRP